MAQHISVTMHTKFWRGNIAKLLGDIRIHVYGREIGRDDTRWMQIAQICVSLLVVLNLQSFFSERWLKRSSPNRISLHEPLNRYTVIKVLYPAQIMAVCLCYPVLCCADTGLPMGRYLIRDCSRMTNALNLIGNSK